MILNGLLLGLTPVTPALCQGYGNIHNLYTSTVHDKYLYVLYKWWPWAGIKNATVGATSSSMAAVSTSRQGWMNKHSLLLFHTITTKLIIMKLAMYLSRYRDNCRSRLTDKLLFIPTAPQESRGISLVRKVHRLKKDSSICRKVSKQLYTTKVRKTIRKFVYFGVN